MTCSECTTNIWNLLYCFNPLEEDCDCFPSVAIVKNQDGKSITMSGLKIGDKVQTGENIKWQMY